MKKKITLLMIVCVFMIAIPIVHASEPQTGRHELIILFDNSGSMNDNDTEHMAAQALMDFLNHLPASWDVGFVSYNIAVTDYVFIHADSRDAINALLYESEYISFTNFAAGMQKAVSLFSADAAARIVLFVSDGEMAVMPTQALLDAAIAGADQVIGQLIDKDIVVHSVMVSYDFDVYQDDRMMMLSWHTGGMKISVETSAEIPNAISALLRYVFATEVYDVSADDAENGDVLDNDDVLDNEVAFNYTQDDEHDSAEDDDSFIYSTIADETTDIDRTEVDDVSQDEASSQLWIVFLILFLSALIIIGTIYFITKRNQKNKPIPPTTMSSKDVLRECAVFTGRVDTYGKNKSDGHEFLKTSYSVNSEEKSSFFNKQKPNTLIKTLSNKDIDFIVEDDALYVVNHLNTDVFLNDALMQKGQRYHVLCGDKIDMEQSGAMMTFVPRFKYDPSLAR